MQLAVTANVSCGDYFSGGCLYTNHFTLIFELLSDLYAEIDWHHFDAGLRMMIKKAVVSVVRDLTTAVQKFPYDIQC
jgi:hypothetical protein